MYDVTIDKIIYKAKINKKLVNKESIKVFGLDTETREDGKCFLICTSEGDAWKFEEFPRCLFSRKYRSKKFVCYNLKFDETAMLQFLSIEELKELREKQEVIHEEYNIKIIPNKMLSISYDGHAVTFFDLFSFFTGSLDYNSEKYLGRKKIQLATKKFNQMYINDNWHTLCGYCIRDAILTRDLGNLLISKFENYGLTVRNLYSTAYISYQYFREKCDYPLVDYFYRNHKKLLNMSLESYAGGKFEVTRKKSGYLYEYDIVSAYPAEIANLTDITNSYVKYNQKYEKNADYSFLKIKFKMPENVSNPIAYKRDGVNIFPCGDLEATVTKRELEYLQKYDVDYTIIEASHIFTDVKIYPFREAINNLVKLKSQYKESREMLDYHTVKIIMNSLYGKFCQLIKKGQFFHASANWNPVYSTVITANCRLKVTEMQQRYKSIIAVHTDSLISDQKLDIEIGKELGNFDFEIEGFGAVFGCGVYQVGEKSKMRGFHTQKPLLELANISKNTIDMSHIHSYSWREVAFHNWEKNLLNKFETVEKTLKLNFDRKRVWFNDYNKFSDIFDREVESSPIFYNKYLFR